ncbi:hypothetical protein H5410_033755 [Solanum commersonii]|uniref:Late blight resistance protein n=1 Tax=Solanum commersonii TaxID=4109 RepID=A0A9J5YPJ4_SOLCO|nr:hypothetical protein H5410_033755 [Solanum commersonii]
MTRFKLRLRMQLLIFFLSERFENQQEWLDEMKLPNQSITHPTTCVRNQKTQWVSGESDAKQNIRKNNE